MIINRIYEKKPSVAVACFIPGRAKDLSAPLYYHRSYSVFLNNRKLPSFLNFVSQLKHYFPGTNCWDLCLLFVELLYPNPKWGFVLVIKDAPVLQINTGV